MKVYMVRHGQSEANFYERVSNPTVPLTQQGVLDGEAAGRLLRDISFDAVIVSPYLRAIQTQQAALPNARPIIMDEVHEFYCGQLENRLFADIRAEYGELVNNAFAVDDFSPFGGESYDEVRKNRIAPFLKYCEELGLEHIAVFSHAGFILTTFDVITGRPCKPGRNVHCDNGSVSIFEYDGKAWQVRAMNITENVLK